MRRSTKLQDRSGRRLSAIDAAQWFGLLRFRVLIKPEDGNQFIYLPNDKSL